MKSLLLLALATVSLNSFANGVTPLKAGDKSISKAHSKIISVTSICPQSPVATTCAAFGSIVKIEVSLDGCIDRLGGSFSSFEEVNGTGVLTFAAINIFNKASLTAMCIQQNKQTVTVYVPYEGEITLKDMNYDGEIKPMHK
jgi:hypothetical protein